MTKVFDKITSFIDKYLVMGMGILLAAAVAFGAWQTWSLSSARSDLTEATTKIESLNDKVTSQQATIELKDTTISVLEDRSAERLAEQQTYNFDLQGVLNAPADENQNPVDDVVCRAISGTKCLRSN